MSAALASPFSVQRRERRESLLASLSSSSRTCLSLLLFLSLSLSCLSFPSVLSCVRLSAAATVRLSCRDRDPPFLTLSLSLHPHVPMETAFVGVFVRRLYSMLPPLLLQSWMMKTSSALLAFPLIRWTAIMLVAAATAVAATTTTAAAAESAARESDRGRKGERRGRRQAGRHAMSSGCDDCASKSTDSFHFQRRKG